MVAFIDAHREQYGVEPICGALPIAPSTYYRLKAQQADPTCVASRTQRDRRTLEALQAAYTASGRRYGIRKLWHVLQREGYAIARCTVERLVRVAGIRGVVRGRRVRTTVPEPLAHRPADLVQRQFVATRPHQLWVADFTYVATWRGFVYVAFVIDVFARRIVGWRATSSVRSDLALDALEQALYDRELDGPLVHHSDRGVQYLSIRYTDRLTQAGIAASVGSRGDSYDNALAETVIGLYKAEVIRHQGPWRGLEDVEYATLIWVAWYNDQRLMGPLGYLSPAEYEVRYHQTQVARHDAGTQLTESPKNSGRFTDSTGVFLQKVGLCHVGDDQECQGPIGDNRVNLCESVDGCMDARLRANQARARAFAPPAIALQN